MLFVEYPKCTTCQRAKKFLDAHGAAYTDRHIKEERPTAEELRTWQQASGLPLKKFFNTSGLLYKSMGLKDKLPAMSEEEQLELLAYWNQIPPKARLRLLDSTITVSTLGELKKLAEELGTDTTVPPNREGWVAGPGETWYSHAGD